MIKEAGARLPNIFVEEGRRKQFFTRSLDKGKSVYGEKLVVKGKDEYRAWDPTRSKLAAALSKGLSQSYIKEGDVILYLGASTGTTPSHLSDVVGSKGVIFALDFAPRVVRELVFMCERRDNLMPLLGDAKKPSSYSHLISGADFVYMDIAQRDQSDIFIKNCDVFLKEGGFGMLFVKAKSIDISKKPTEIYSIVKKDLEKAGLVIVDFKKLDPHEKDHCLFLIKKK